jgi:hypothetical protein
MNLFPNSLYTITHISFLNEVKISRVVGDRLR